jgi:hypothetical protein
MIGALVILLLVIGGFVAFRALNRDNPETPVRAVDYGKTLAFAEREADFDVLAPPRLPTGWKATSVGFTPPPKTHWHLGLLTDTEHYLGIEQGPGSLRSMITTYVDQAPSRAGSVDVDGRSWQVWRDSGGDTALATRKDGVSNVVVGTVDRQALVDFVGTLE